MKCILLYNIRGFKIQPQSAEFNTTIAITITLIPITQPSRKGKNITYYNCYLEVIAMLFSVQKKVFYILLLISTKIIFINKNYLFILNLI